MINIKLLKEFKKLHYTKSELKSLKKFAEGEMKEWQKFINIINEKYEDLSNGVNKK